MLISSSYNPDHSLLAVHIEIRSHSARDQAGAMGQEEGSVARAVRKSTLILTRDPVRAAGRALVINKTNPCNLHRPRLAFFLLQSHFSIQVRTRSLDRLFGRLQGPFVALNDKNRPSTAHSSSHTTCAKNSGPFCAFCSFDDEAYPLKTCFTAARSS
ncbi:hypothetical protein FA15DRAFT_364331 [Coprinopsis marcescibilis]|uniref:Uncharacterized protein n=1 Tax=Coprinopsis marcescibilis TaxID=230819 RepID=A0A5C3KYL4_COPMA|nr:hypothetical protein FA15DRAFT_364331 [Coprinopsis marcescibilis]